jgi:hypothetical protein
MKSECEAVYQREHDLTNMQRKIERDRDTEKS